MTQSYCWEYIYQHYTILTYQSQSIKVKPIVKKCEQREMRWETDLTNGFSGCQKLILNWFANSDVVTHTLVEHVCLMSQGGVLTQLLSDHLHPLHLQPLELLRRRAICNAWVREKSLRLHLSPLSRITQCKQDISKCLDMIHRPSVLLDKRIQMEPVACS